MGACFIRGHEGAPKEILKDLVEMCKGVQHPTRGLFLRSYLCQVRHHPAMPFVQLAQTQLYLSHWVMYESVPLSREGVAKACTGTAQKLLQCLPAPRCAQKGLSAELIAAIADFLSFPAVFRCSLIIKCTACRLLGGS